jgi:hypothetical protein
MGLLCQLAADVLQACGADSNLVQIIIQSQYHYIGATHDFSAIGSDVHQDAKILAVADAFVCDVILKACMVLDMIVYKLNVFVDGNGAKLGKVNANSVEMRLGTRGILSGWGKTADKQPLDIRLEIGDSRTITQRGANRLVEIQVRITPIGRVRKADVFKTRCSCVLKVPRQYLAADFDDMSEWD